MVTPSGIQTWVFSLQLCLNVVDDLNRSATTAGFNLQVNILLFIYLKSACQVYYLPLELFTFNGLMVYFWSSQFYSCKF